MHGAREARQRRGGVGERPIAVHAEVRVQHPTIVEMQQLVLAATLDARDPCAGERAQLRGREPALQRGMQQSHAHDRAPPRACAQELQGGFDLGQFGHRTSW